MEVFPAILSAVNARKHSSCYIKYSNMQRQLLYLSEPFLEMYMGIKMKCKLLTTWCKLRVKKDLPTPIVKKTVAENAFNKRQHRVKAKFFLNRWYFRWPHYSRCINFLENPIHICAYAVLAGGLTEMAKTQELIFFWPE